MKVNFALMFTVIFLNNAFSQSGTLDPTFGTSGKITTHIGAWAQAKAMAVQTDGKVVVAGYSFNGTKNDFTLVRYNSDGSLDMSFGGTGKVTTAIGLGGDYATSIAIQADGKILVAGYSFNGKKDDFALVRYNVDGSLDMSFGNDGKVTTSIGTGFDFTNAIGIQNNGKILVAGSSSDGTHTRIALARFNINGSLDATFDEDGKLITQIGLTYDNANALAIGDDGRIIVTGYTHDGSKYNFALVKYLANGMLDKSFDTDGITTLEFGTGSSYANSLAIQKDSKIVLAGKSFNNGNYDFALARFNANGRLDSSFNNNGKVVTTVGSFNDEALAPEIQSDGKIIVAGVTNTGSFNSIAVTRYNQNGTLDIDFGKRGIVITAIKGVTNDYASGIKLHSSRIYVAGYSHDSNTADFALVAYQNIQAPQKLDFSASMRKSYVACTWQSAPKVNASYYTVQRSNDGVHFYNVAKLYSTQKSLEKEFYSFNDDVSQITRNAMKLYYRIQITDSDGTNSTSSAITVNLKQKNLFSILPNPATTYIQVNSTVLHDLTIIDNGGTEVLKEKSYPAGIARFNISRLPPGIYAVKMTDNLGNVETEKLVIQ